MFKQPLDVICLNETFCDSSISDSEITYPTIHLSDEIETVMVAELQCVSETV